MATLEQKTKDWIKSALNDSVLTVSFIKKDGTTRIMRCTLDEKYLPEVQKEITESDESKPKSKDALAVYDLDANGWRAFRWDSLKTISLTLGTLGE